MSDDRLKELQRQRELARQQQEQLDREIAREMSQAAPAQPKAPAATPSVPQPPANPALDAHADEIIAQYNTNPRPIRDEVKSGCLVYFFSAFALVGLALLVLYLFNRH